MPRARVKSWTRHVSPVQATSSHSRDLYTAMGVALAWAVGNAILPVLKLGNHIVSVSNFPTVKIVWSAEIPASQRTEDCITASKYFSLHESSSTVNIEATRLLEVTISNKTSQPNASIDFWGPFRPYILRRSLYQPARVLVQLTTTKLSLNQDYQQDLPKLYLSYPWNGTCLRSEKRACKTVHHSHSQYPGHSGKWPPEFLCTK